MAAVAVTNTSVGLANSKCRVVDIVAGATINGGQAVYVDTSGLAQVANSSDTTHGQFAGIAIPTKSSGYAAATGQTCLVCQEGPIEGFTLSGVAYWGLVYLADDGTFATTAGTKSVPIGKVIPSTDKDSSGNYKKLLYVLVPWLTAVT